MNTATQPYREITEPDADPSYQFLVGPNGFECGLTEPEDRCWSRDLRPVVEELNRLYAAQQKAERQIATIIAILKKTSDRLQNESDMSYFWGFEAAVDIVEKAITDGEQKP